MNFRTYKKKELLYNNKLILCSYKLLKTVQKHLDFNGIFLTIYQQIYKQYPAGDEDGDD